MTAKTAATAKGAPSVEQLLSVGAHYAYSRSRRHPSARPFIFGTKEGVEIFDIEQTRDALGKAADFLAAVAAAGKPVIFVSGKKEIARLVKAAAESAESPYVVGRWIGGTLTNFEAIQKRISLYHELREQREKGELAKYTKKERLLIDRKIEDLEESFGGISQMRTRPGAIVAIDPKREHIAVTEAMETRVPVVALANADCDLAKVGYPIPGNDSAIAAVELVLGCLAEAVKVGKAELAAKPALTAAPAA